jgi:uncharacterized membrane protein YdjX (TVP38/TMEM64 family)
MAQADKKSIPWKLLLLAPIAALAIYLAVRFDLRDLLRRSLDWIRALGPLGPVLFVLIYVVASVLFVPASILTLGAGWAFGVLRGSLYVTVGATFGATAAFLVARYLLRDWVARRIEGNPKFAAIDDAVGREGGKIVLLTRLSPIFPFNLLNYGFGITKVSLRSYFLASAVGMIPGTLTYVYVGSILGNLATAGKDRQRSPVEWGLLIVGLLATIAVTLFITRLARKALETKL